jgi:hypothetical protein
MGGNFDKKAGTYWFGTPAGEYIPLGSSSIKRQLQMGGMDVDFVGANDLKNWERVLSVV